MHKKIPVLSPIHKYWNTYRDRMKAVTAKDVMEAAKTHLHPDKLVMLIVGNWEEIAKGDADERATMAQFYEGKATEIPLRDPLTLEPMASVVADEEGKFFFIAGAALTAPEKLGICWGCVDS